MPTVLLTGITGFLAAHIAVTFLKNGWDVRGTLRSASKQAAFDDIPELAPYVKSGKLTFIITGDLASADWSAAVTGVDAVVHTASPVEFDNDDFVTKHLNPAQAGTRDVLLAAAKEEGVKAVVMTSTYGAVGNHRVHPTALAGQVFDEKDWNPYTKEELIKMSDENGSGNPWFPAGYLYYMGAKKYAELAAWDVQKETGNKWPLATMLCPMIYGPAIQPLSSLSNSGLSTGVFYGLMAGKDAAVQETLYPFYVDVRDAAEGHYQAIVRKANGRFVLSAGAYSNQECADLGREHYPEIKDRFNLGQPGAYSYRDPGVYHLDNAKSVKELGMSYRSKEETVFDTFDKILELEKKGLN